MLKDWAALMAKVLAGGALLHAIAVGLWMLFGLSYGYGVATPTGIRETGTITALEFALRHGDAVYFFWPTVITLAALTGLLAAWRRKTAFVWAAGLTLAGICLFGFLSIIGLAVAPAAAALLMAALLLSWRPPGLPGR